jgi:6,7-dimethyl-8-ribityllumazine synthase
MKDSPKLKLQKDAAQGKHFVIVVSRYHEALTTKLQEGAVETLQSYGAKAEDITTYWVPGAFEIPAAARMVIQHQTVDAIICLGIILKGETTHNAYIAREVARGVAQIHVSSGIPAIFGVLTPDTLEQAKARAGGSKENKGVECAETALAMIELLDEIKQGANKKNKSVGF